jgi:alpha-L-rhamnosidase
VPGVSWIKASYDTVRGRIESNWEITDGTLTLRVTVPWNTTATVKLPDGRSEEIAAGRHQFTIQRARR